jgi:hypothetical protein
MEKYSIVKYQNLSIIKMATVLKLIYRFNNMPIRSLPGLSTEIDNQALKLICNYKRPKIAKNFEKKQNRRNHTIWFWIYYKAILIKTVWY